jgi:hypothetical protein
MLSAINSHRAYNPSNLFWYVGKYIPTGWRVDISNVAFVPNWIYDEYSNLQKGIYTNKVTWYEKEAIEAYFGRI